MADLPEGVRFQHTTLSPGQWPEGYLTWHALAVHRNHTKESYVWPGARRPVSGTAGFLDFIPAEFPFSVGWTEPFEVISLNISPAFVSEFVQPAGASLKFKEDAGFEDPLLAHLLLNLDSEMNAGNPSGRLYAESISAAALAQLIRTHACAPPKLGVPKGSLPLNRLRRLVEYIDANLHRQISLAELAGIAEMNVFHMLRTFKVTLGVPPHRYILQRRVERAKALLRNRALSISEIALGCGYAEQSSFTRAFQKVTGAAPAFYRNSVAR
jgi:AraC family transcriptional regulator